MGEILPVLQGLKPVLDLPWQMEESMAAPEKIASEEFAGEKNARPESAGGTNGANRPIDLVHLSRQSLGDPGLEAEILHMFDQLLTNYMARIRKSSGMDETLVVLHSLKGAAAGVGANNIAVLARNAELETRLAGKLSHEFLCDIGMAVEEVRHFIAELLED